MNCYDDVYSFAGAYRVLKPGAFFAIAEHGLGPAGDPHYPLPWSEDGVGSYLVPPPETQSRLETAGFESIVIQDTGSKYLAFTAT